ncbi:MAG: SET domain-containing protein-lysine N-methyltransferase [Candidatus Electrothrix sp. MAN1_4]|nr:SET domain-containing protein-lysine N-methyltransferase [Candidatus Electrothrix sp. MAN1_4]
MLLYPDEYDLDPKDGYPKAEDFTVSGRERGKGEGVYTKKPFERGQLIARITGNIVPRLRQHTLQITPTTHLHDQYFTGFLLHSCSPNVLLDMREFEVWALRDIEAGQALTMDYASTEDVLYRQFPCLCGTPNCRYWITGRKELVSEEGRTHIASELDKVGRDSTEIVTV